MNTASICTWSPWGAPMRLPTRSSAVLISVPLIHVYPSGLRWYMAPNITKSEPSLFARMMSSSLAERPTLPSPAARTCTTAGVFGPP